MHFVEPMHAGRCFLRNSAPILHNLVPAIWILSMNLEQQVFDNLFFLIRRFRFSPIAAFLQLVAFMNEQRGVSAIIDDQFVTFAFRMRNRPISAPPLTSQCFSSPREDRY